MKKRPRKLQLRTETVRQIATVDLARVASGCDTTSWTTEKPIPDTGATCA